MNNKYVYMLASGEEAMSDLPEAIKSNGQGSSSGRFFCSSLDILVLAIESVEKYSAVKPNFIFTFCIFSLANSSLICRCLHSPSVLLKLVRTFHL